MNTLANDCVFDTMERKRELVKLHYFYAYGLAEFDISEFVSLKLFIGPSI